MDKIPKAWKDKVKRKWEPEFVVSSGSLNLDNSDALQSYKGIPAGTMVQISSDNEGAFKTSLALQGAANIQKDLDKKIVFIDAECGLTGLDWVEQMGILTDEKHWIYAQPDSGEEACDMIDFFIQQDDVGGVIADSIDAMVPQKQLDSEHGDADIGLHAKLITRAVRKWKSMVRTHQTILWLVNQKKVNLTHMGAMGTKSTGGRAINFYCKLNIDMRKNKSDNQLKSERIIPLTMSVKRSKLGISYIDVPTYAMQGTGIDNNAELKDLAEQYHLVTQSGSWWKEVDPETGEVGDTIGQGIEPVRTWCSFNKELILSKLKEDGDSKTVEEETD